ncbi:hypothetical protein GCM10008023_35860 [Sphingomonas glacialis]|uniref:Resolvase/invertase-type recombinase catalytic domain-containing protein n=1 Tax=Sphingomonas glacialis TaxID=658225 RepID=A0ABQ3LRD0_9SPHN|nr:hypothetical protein GCM10008023_35860 [Sphingomonas glacialis]
MRLELIGERGRRLKEAEDIVATQAGEEGVRTAQRRGPAPGRLEGLADDATGRARKIGQGRESNIDVVRLIKAFDQFEVGSVGDTACITPLIARWTSRRHSKGGGAIRALGESRGDDRGIKAAGKVKQDVAKGDCPGCDAA